MTEARRPAYGEWFGGLWFGAHHPVGRLACGLTSLVFLAFPLSELWSGGHSLAAEAVGSAGLAAFAAVFLRLFWILPWVAGERRREAAALLGAIAVLGISLAIAFGDEWLGLLFYLSLATALTVPVRLAVPGVALVSATALPIAGGIGDGSGLALELLIFGLLFVAVRRLMELVRELEAARAQVAEHAVNEERLRLSRDLHDLLGHNLSVIALKSELARKLLGRDPPAAEGEIRDVEAVARESLQEARAAVRGLRHASLAAEVDRAREALEAADIEVSARTEGALPSAAGAPLAFAVREATTNVIRHSRARHCRLEVRSNADGAELEVRDDGVGPAAEATDGSGLRGLGERLAEVGGTLEAGPAPGGGFRLIASVPLRPPPQVSTASGNPDPVPAAR